MPRGAELPRGAIGSADLLRLLAVDPRDRVCLDDSADGWFGYERQPASTPPIEITKDKGKPPPRTQPTIAQPAAHLPLHMPFAFAIVRRDKREVAAVEERVAVPSTGSPFEESRLAPRKAKRVIGYEDLVPWPRLLPALRRQLASRRVGPLDLDRLTGAIASGRLPRRLPRRVHERWHPDMVVVLDFSPQLWPYREDMHRLAERLLRLVGRNRVSLRIIDNGPQACWTDWVEQQNRSRAALPAEHLWVMPAAGTPVLLVTDAGLLPGPQSPPANDWRRFAADLARAQVRALALMPLGANQLDASFPLPVLRWSPDARPHCVRARGAACEKPAGLPDLLAMASVLRRIDPPLLRAMRQALPAGSLDAGLEGAVWCHPDVDSGFTAAIREEAAGEHRRRFADRLPTLQRAVNDLRASHHAHLNRALDYEERLLWDAHAALDDKTAVADALAFFCDLADALSKAGDAPPIWRQIAEGVYRRCDGAMRQRHGAVYHRLVEAAAKSRSDVAPVVPDWVDPAVLATLPSGHAPGNAWLVQDVARMAILLQAEPPGPRQVALGDAISFNEGGISVQEAGEHDARLHSVASLPIVLARLDEPGAEAHLTTATEILQLAAVPRPRGAARWGFDDSGLFVQSPKLGPVSYEFRSNGRPPLLRFARAADGGWACEADAALAARRSYERDGSSTGESSHPGNAIPPTPQGEGSIAVRFGLDAFGMYAELDLRTPHCAASQRFRWIEPGGFEMGSPEDEPGRDDDEGPQHPVTITRGFWLADTPCTQAFWQAVMGDNPSNFKSPDRPVELVSWEDVQRFLAELEKRLPGCGAGLPSEAEWEHACRAGTTGAIYKGDFAILGANNAPSLDPIAWYGGNSGVGFELDNGYDSSGWKEKQYDHARAGTMPVAQKQPNAWGLYDMLGNVWEWCADGKRSYTDEPQVDPFAEPDAGDAAPRAVRGGSWIDVAGGVRSAYRSAHRPGSDVNDLGFRLSLRSIESGRSSGRLGGPDGSAPGGRPPASPRDEAEPAGFFSRVQQRLGRATKKAPKKKR